MLFLPKSIVLNSDPSLLDPTDKSEKCKIADFYKSFTLYPLGPIGYTRCDVVPYDLQCPSMAMRNPDYVNPRYCHFYSIPVNHCKYLVISVSHCLLVSVNHC